MLTLKELLIISLFHWISAGCAIFAAAFWLWAAMVPMPVFPLVGDAHSVGSLDLFRNATPLRDFAEAFKERSRLSRIAATFAAAASVCQSAAMLLFPYLWNY